MTVSVDCYCLLVVDDTDIVWPLVCIVIVCVVEVTSCRTTILVPCPCVAGVTAQSAPGARRVSRPTTWCGGRGTKYFISSVSPVWCVASSCRLVRNCTFWTRTSSFVKRTTSVVNFKVRLKLCTCSMYVLLCPRHYCVRCDWSSRTEIMF